MAKLTEDQKQAVARWAAEGATLNEIQGRLKGEFDLTLTYMETRLLVMELGVKLVDKPREKLPEPPPTPTARDTEDSDPNGEPDLEPMDAPAAGGSKVTLTIDEITIPGTMVSQRQTSRCSKANCRGCSRRRATERATEVRS